MTDHGTSRFAVCADRNYSASQRVANEKAHHNGWAFSKLLVAWGGIEPPTQGFSVLQNYYLAALNHVVEYIQINSLHTNNWMGEQFPC